MPHHKRFHWYTQKIRDRLDPRGALVMRMSSERPGHRRLIAPDSRRNQRIRQPQSIPRLDERRHVKPQFTFSLHPLFLFPSHFFLSPLSIVDGDSDTSTQIRKKTQNFFPNTETAVNISG